MTRINCVPVDELMDQHLLAEYREITRISSLARPLASSEAVNTYRMGAGHVKFFYDKGKWLTDRTNAIYSECIKRGFNPQQKEYKQHPTNLNNDWQPSDNDIHINRIRLQEKLDMKPDFYKYYGVKRTQ